MIGFIKRLWRDRRGNALVIAGAALPLVVGSAGLAVDTVQWAMWKRQLQRAADSAAFAGAYTLADDNAGMTAEQAVANDLLKHQTTGVTLVSGYPQISFPTASGYTDAVRVTLAIQKPLGFSSLFLSQAPTIITSATAALVEEYDYCVVALAETGTGLIIGGSANVNMGCGAISNADDPIDSVETNGTAYNFVAEPVAAFGGMPPSINGVTTLLPFSTRMEDPYSSLSTSVPSGVSCTNFTSHIVGGPSGDLSVPEVLTPGCFSTFNARNKTYILQPGVYYLNNADLNLNGNTRLQGEGVTIIMTGTDPGSVTMNGNSSIALSAPTSGPYVNMVLIQAANADVGNNNTISGDNLSSLDGSIYFPSGDVTFTGSSAGATECAMIVAYTVEFTGNNSVQNDPSACDAATTVEGVKVRLVA